MHLKRGIDDHDYDDDEDRRVLCRQLIKIAWIFIGFKKE